MAKKQDNKEVEDVMVLDDEDTEVRGGGFQDDSQLFEPEESSAETEMGEKEEETDLEGDDQDGEDQETSESEGEGETDDEVGEDGEGEAEGEADGQDDPYSKFNEMLNAQAEASRSQIAALTSQIKTLQDQIAGKQETKEEPEEEPDWPTDDDWAENPTEAHKRMQAIYSKQQAKEDAEQASKQQAQQRIQADQKQAYGTAVNLCPEIDMADSPVRKTMVEIWQNKDNQLQDLSLGPLYASALAMLINGVGPFSGGPNKDDIDTGAKMERSRQDRVKKGAMHGSGKKGGANKIQLTDHDRQVIKDMGVSEKSYLDSKRQLGIS